VNRSTPAVDGDVVDLDAVLGEEFFDVAVGHAEAQVPGTATTITSDGPEAGEVGARRARIGSEPPDIPVIPSAQGRPVRGCVGYRCSTMQVRVRVTPSRPECGRRSACRAHRDRTPARGCDPRRADRRRRRLPPRGRWCLGRCPQDQGRSSLLLVQQVEPEQHPAAVMPTASAAPSPSSRPWIPHADLLEPRGAVELQGVTRPLEVYRALASARGRPPGAATD
jgi:hypothetical protein